MVPIRFAPPRPLCTAEPFAHLGASTPRVAALIERDRRGEAGALLIERDRRGEAGALLIERDRRGEAGALWIEPDTHHSSSIGRVTLRVRLFAVLRERAGSESVEIELTEGATVADALAEVSTLAPLAELLDRMPVRMAVNRAYVSPETRLGPDDELALIPPISGGAEVYARVTGEPLSLEALVGAVSRPGAGAVVSFQGVTREVSRLDYEAYREMAEERIETILRECVERHGLEAAAAEHRVGAVPLGHSAVIVSVSAAHRGEAFAGAREAIDRIKAEAPIWKREVGLDGGAWVAGEPPPLDAAHREEPAS